MRPVGERRMRVRYKLPLVLDQRRHHQIPAEKEEPSCIVTVHASFTAFFFPKKMPRTQPTINLPTAVAIHVGLVFRYRLPAGPPPHGIIPSELSAWVMGTGACVSSLSATNHS